MSMEIYFAASITGGRGDQQYYSRIIEHLKRYGEVLTEHLGNESLDAGGEGLPDRRIHDRDMDWLLSADVVVAEITTPSLGVGYEIGRAVEQGKRILALYRPTPGKRASGMILGSPFVAVRAYHNLAEARRSIDEFFT
jgi:hypothetical protein